MNDPVRARRIAVSASSISSTVYFYPPLFFTEVSVLLALRAPPPSKRNALNQDKPNIVHRCLRRCPFPPPPPPSRKMHMKANVCGVHAGKADPVPEGGRD